MVGGQPALFHRRGGQGRKADDVAHGVDVLDLGLEGLVVDKYPAPGVGFQSGVAQPEAFGLPLTTGGIHHCLGRDLLAAGQCGHGSGAADVDSGHLLAESERDGQVAQVESQ